jgi:hypothetical protein
MYKKLGQDYETFIALPSDAAIETMPGGVAPTEIYTVPSISYPPIDTGSGWNWADMLKNVLVPVSTAAAGIIRATTGKPEPTPTGYIRTTAGLVPAPTQNWIIPALLIGGGALWFFSRKR